MRWYHLQLYRGELFRSPHILSAGDQRQDLLGERNDDTARNGQNAICALGRIVRLEGQTDLQNAEAEQNQADRTDQGKDEIAQVIDNGKRIAVCRERRDNKTASMKNTLAKIE